MNIYFLSLAESYSIGIAAIAGLVRFRKLHESYRPFIYVCCLAFLNEIVSTVTAQLFRNNAVNLNLYVLAECFLYLWQFYNWGAFRLSKNSYYRLCTLLFLTWVADNFFINSIFTINSFFRIVYSFTLIFLAISQVNRMILIRREAILKDSRFLVCMGIIIFYSYKAFFETFYLLKLNFSDQFYILIHLVLEAVNLFVNLIFAFAVLWIPKRQKFLLPF